MEYGKYTLEWLTRKFDSYCKSYSFFIGKVIFFMIRTILEKVLKLMIVGG